MEDTTKKVLFFGTLGLAIAGILAYASPAQSNVQVKPGPGPGPLPPAKRPGNLPPGGTTPPANQTPEEAAAAAIEAALGGAQGATSPGASMPSSPPKIPSGLLLPNPALLIKGQRYKSRLELSTVESFASNDMIRLQFEGLGFTNVQVSQTPPPQGSWPALAYQNITTKSRWVEGTWNSNSQTVPQPSQIQNAWTA